MLPLLLGGGMRLTESLTPDAALTFERERALPGGSVEIVYALSRGEADAQARDPDWAPPSQRGT